MNNIVKQSDTYAQHTSNRYNIDKDRSTIGWFTHVDGCTFVGDTVADTIADAQSTIDAHFEVSAENDMAILPAGKMKGHIGKDDEVYISGQWMLICQHGQVRRAGRKNIKLPHRPLHQIDNAVKHNQNTVAESRLSRLQSVK